MKSKTARIVIRLPLVLNRRVRREAKASGKSINLLTREALTRSLERRR